MMRVVGRAALAAAMLILATAGVALGAEPVAVIDWSTQAPLSGEVVNEQVVVEAGTGGVFPLGIFDGPPLSGGDIVVSVNVEVDRVASPGFLELWAVYDGDERYFSRSFDANGVGLLVDGASLTVELPFALSGTVPRALELNLVLPDDGRIIIGDVGLYEVAAGSAAQGLSAADAWWSTEAGGLIGAIGGSVLGLLGAAVGFLSSRGKARRFVMTTMAAGTLLGATALVAGIAAVVLGQPYEVWFPLVLMGGLLVVIFGGLYRSVGDRYEALELQRMRAYDLV